MRKHPHSHREDTATAPVLDSTPDFTQSLAVSEIAGCATCRAFREVAFAPIPAQPFITNAQ